MHVLFRLYCFRIQFCLEFQVIQSSREVTQLESIVDYAQLASREIMENHGFKNQRERLVLCDASSLYLEQFLSDFNAKTQQFLNSTY